MQEIFTLLFFFFNPLEAEGVVTSDRLRNAKLRLTRLPSRCLALLATQIQPKRRRQTVFPICPPFLSQNSDPTDVETCCYIIAALRPCGLEE